MWLRRDQLNIRFLEKVVNLINIYIYRGGIGEEYDLIFL